MESIMQRDRECWVTGSTENLDLHHCFHGSRRKAADEWGCTVWLRHDIHMDLHQRNPALDQAIKAACQERFEALYGHEKFMEVFGKSYI